MLPVYTPEEQRRDREEAIAYYMPSAERRMTQAAALLGVLFLFFAIGYAVAKAEGSHDHSRVIGKERTAPQWRTGP
jgi:hypothetical protein